MLVGCSKRLTARCPVKVSFRERKVSPCLVPKSNDFGTVFPGLLARIAGELNGSPSPAATSREIGRKTLAPIPYFHTHVAIATISIGNLKGRRDGGVLK
jgi:hypothetical protein